MNILTISLSFLLGVWFAAAPAVKTKTDAAGRRITKIINSGWTFNYFPEKTDILSIDAPSFDDSKWQCVSIPHTWSTYETTGELHPYIRNAAESDDPYWWTGWGWYRKHFSINEKYSDRKVFIEFEGVMKYCKVWINGHYLGDHKGGIGSFDFDLTPYIAKGEDNVLVVAVNNLRNDPLAIPQMAAGNFNVDGGIYRDVTLVLKDPLHIPMQGSEAHEGGTFITTPGVSAKESVVRVQTWVKNDNQVPKNCVLKTTITDATGKIIQSISTKASVKPGELYRFDQVSKPVSQPRLWSPDDPYLYKVFSEVMDGKVIVDSYKSPLGFRWFRWDYNENFLYVNGKKTILHGGNRHQESPWLGNAIPKWITEMDLYDMAVNLKYNFIRTAHYPNDKMVYDLTDKYGIIIDEEMIRRDRNHPSIIFRDMGNDTSHFSNFHVQPDTISASGRMNGQKVSASAAMAGEPSKIAVTASHKRINADLSSVVIFRADITDKDGNHVYGATNSVRWSIRGPATLAGPPVYEPDIDRHHSMEGTIYTDMPVTNVIRSAGKPGTIIVTVSSPGLASGSCEIIAEEVIRDNSVITESIPDQTGRIKVAQLTIASVPLREIRKELKDNTDEITLNPSGRDSYYEYITGFVLKANPGIDSSSVEFRTLMALCVSHLVNNNGRLIADDYNFFAEHYNLNRELARTVYITGLPAAFRYAIRKFYAKKIILEGMNLNLSAEEEWIKAIPTEGNIVYVQDKDALSAGKSGVLTNETDLAAIIGIIHPEFMDWPPESKAKVVDFVAGINPYIKTTLKSEVVNDKKITKSYYKVEKGEPIWVPAISYLKK